MLEVECTGHAVWPPEVAKMATKLTAL